MDGESIEDISNGSSSTPVSTPRATPKGSGTPANGSPRYSKLFLYIKNRYYPHLILGYRRHANHFEFFACAHKFKLCTENLCLKAALRFLVYIQIQINIIFGS